MRARTRTANDFVVRQNSLISFRSVPREVLRQFFARTELNLLLFVVMHETKKQLNTLIIFDRVGCKLADH